MKKKFKPSMKFLDFNEPDVSTDSLLELLMSGEKTVMCKNIDIYNKEIQKNLTDSVEKYKSPMLEFYDPCGDDVYYIVSFTRSKYSYE